VLNIAILVVTVLVLFSALKRVGLILSIGSIEKLVEQHENKLTKLKKDLSRPDAKNYFGFAWLVALLITTSLIGLTTYILVNILNFA
jgi:hypothetical protein